MAENLILPLSEEEREIREQCISVIKKGAKTALLVINAIIIAEQKQLYRETHANLKSWLDSLVPAGTFSPRYSYHLIQAAETEAARQQYAPDTPPIPSERSVRALASVESPVERAQIYTDAVEIAQEAGRPTPTLSDVSEAKQRFQGLGEEKQTLSIADGYKGQKVFRSPYYNEKESMVVSTSDNRLYVKFIRAAMPAKGLKKTSFRSYIPLADLNNSLKVVGLQIVDCAEKGDPHVFDK